ncbi:saccharopine dehydrogenase family protein [Natrarchaeobaculum aegyptiacum]|uniref:Saccharopine dehydrogenase n=1 Tax=Natrarchaeobaculum aegyptiacum TaxID=745377 RepID=A0A2Z2HR39_9EURY|nr:saccharopine dehydrogenase NADP-binding domain-containing protein [Natrarchaeobaculum aegyptiacum]ARS89223.1 saccharopine dehydrogenase [Natrarchaeobaculum aegyptiacum]
MDSVLVYGSYGYTGRLVTREAVARGVRPIVAGRDDARVTQQATALGLEGRTFDLAVPDAIEPHLADVDCVLNCAGPFTATATPMVEACLETETDYLDVTGEFAVVERLRRRNRAARDAGVTVLPAVGYEVVPSDCLVTWLTERCPGADELTLGVRGSPLVSPGTARTLLDLCDEGVVRRNGRLVRVPPAFRSREIDFGDGPEYAITAPWPDVVTAAHGTDLETVEAYVAVPDVARPAVGLSGVAAWLAGREPVRRLLERAIDAAVDGPDERQLATDETVIWAEVRDSTTGHRVSGRVRTPNPYALTTESAVTAAERVLAGEVDAGFQTPATAFGADFVTDLTGIERRLEDDWRPPSLEESEKSRALEREGRRAVDASD